MNGTNGEMTVRQNSIWKSKTSCFTLEKPVQTLRKNGFFSGKTTCFTLVKLGETLRKGYSFVKQQ
jgi:hypothetical protein